MYEKQIKQATMRVEIRKGPKTGCNFPEFVRQNVQNMNFVSCVAQPGALAQTIVYITIIYFILNGLALLSGFSDTWKT